MPRVRWTRLWRDSTGAVVIDVTRGVDVVVQGLDIYRRKVAVRKIQLNQKYHDLNVNLKDIAIGAK